MHIYRIPIDIWIYQIINSHLCLLEIMSLRYTCREFSTRFRHSRIKTIRDVMIKKLSAYVPNPEFFCDLLHKHRHYIGGSLVTAALYGEDWSSSNGHQVDLDLYTCYPLDSHVSHCHYRHYTPFIKETFDLPSCFYTSPVPDLQLMNKQYQLLQPFLHSKNAKIRDSCSMYKYYQDNFTIEEFIDELQMDDFPSNINAKDKEKTETKKWNTNILENIEHSKDTKHYENIDRKDILDKKLTCIEQFQGYTHFSLYNRRYQIVSSSQFLDYNIVYNFPNIFAFKELTDNVATQGLFDGHDLFLPKNPKLFDQLISKEICITITREKLKVRGRHAMGHDFSKIMYLGSILHRRIKYIDRGFKISIYLDFLKSHLDEILHTIRSQSHDNHLEKVELIYKTILDAEISGFLSFSKT